MLCLLRHRRIRISRDCQCRTAFQGRTPHCLRHSRTAARHTDHDDQCRFRILCRKYVVPADINTAQRLVFQIMEHSAVKFFCRQAGRIGIPVSGDDHPFYLLYLFIRYGLCYGLVRQLPQQGLQKRREMQKSIFYLIISSDYFHKNILSFKSILHFFWLL